MYLITSKSNFSSSLDKRKKINTREGTQVSGNYFGSLYRSSGQLQMDLPKVFERPRRCEEKRLNSLRQHSELIMLLSFMISFDHRGVINAPRLIIARS